MTCVRLLIWGGVVALFAAGVSAQPATDIGAPPMVAGPVDAAIVLAVDASNSVDGDERVIQRGGYVAALRHRDFARAIATGRYGRVALAYFEWSGRAHARSQVGWRVIDGPKAAQDFAAEIAALPVSARHGTSISRALAHAAGLLEAAPGPALRRIVDVSGDGPNTFGPPVTVARDALVHRDITVNGLPLLVRPSRVYPSIDRYYEACVIGGPGAFVLAARGASDLAPAIQRKLILEISARTPPAHVIPAALDPVDCRAGERAWSAGGGSAYPGLYE